ncbi:MAG: ABC transporter substrate-binding protein [Clostridiales bacterium]|nr:ABC transporter substrate-binding protein [Clostridiales bacterium]
MKRWPWSILTVLTAALFLFSACGGTSTGTGEGPTTADQVLHDWLTTDPKTFDVQGDTTIAVYEMGRNLYSTLVRYKKGTLELEPELLAKMPEISPDGLTYSFELRDNIVASDGTTRLTSSDVLYTIKRMLDPNGGGASPWLFEPIKGAKDFMEGKTQDIEGFIIQDDTHFQIVLEAPYAPFLQYLAVPAASIYIESLVKAAGDEWPTKPVGTGPFYLDTYIPDQKIVFKKNPYYFEEGLPKLDAIEIRIIPDEATGLLDFEKGTFDITSIPDTDFERITTSGKYTILKNDALNTYFFLFNMDNPQFADKRVRQAIAMAIDKEKMVKTLLGGRGSVAHAFVTPGIPGAFPPGEGPALPYDPEKAKALVEEAGATGKTITIWQSGKAGDSASNTNLAIQEMLRAIGLELKVEIRDRSAYFEARAKGEIPGYQGNWWADFPDPDNYLWTFFHSSSSKRYSSNYKNPEVDRLLEAALNSSDPAERARLYQRVEDIVVGEDVAVVPLYHLQQFRALQPNVKDVVMYQTGLVDYRWTYKEPGR